MRRSLVAIVVVPAMLIGAAWAQDQKAGGSEEDQADVKEKEAPAFQYVGFTGCKTCHKSEKSGNQLGIWLEGPHAKAFATLGAEAAVALGKEKGLKSSPQEAPECLRCHATAAGLTADQMAKPLALEDGVQCESCHGPGSAYKKLSVMKDHAKSVEAGLWEISEETCLKCHNDQSPTFKGFDYEKYVVKIAHPTPVPEKETKGAE